MRADRLVSILMLLQSRARLSAPELAAELGVSVRTIYRDIDALSQAGIPVYMERGAGGGCRLIENYRTTLTGLTRDEMNALLMLDIPEPLELLDDAGDKLHSALLKLEAVHAARPDERAVSPTIFLDWVAWGSVGEPAPHLHTLYVAAQRGCRVQVRYRLWGYGDIERTLEPFGLVAKAGVWYAALHGDGRVRVFRVSELSDVIMLDETFTRPADFDLAAFWKAQRDEIERGRARFPVEVLLQGSALEWVCRYLWPHAQRLGVAVDGRERLAVCFESLEAARTQILGLGGAVEVISPEPLRQSVRDFADRIVAVYQK